MWLPAPVRVSWPLHLVRTAPAMTLRAVPPLRAHDLPPRWDGQLVVWQGWSETPTSMRFHSPKERCDHCRSEQEPMVNLGLLHPKPGETFEVERSRRLRSGRQWTELVDVSAWPVIHLAAFRCPECRCDQVHDSRDDSWWDLDPSDYADEGSWDGHPQLPLL